MTERKNNSKKKNIYYILSVKYHIVWAHLSVRVDRNDVLKIAHKHHIWHGFSQTDRIKGKKKRDLVLFFFFGGEITMLKIDISFTTHSLNFAKLKVIEAWTLQNSTQRVFELKSNYWNNISRLICNPFSFSLAGWKSC